MTIKITRKYLIAFGSLIFLCGISHELVHHFTGAAICGCIGYKTFNSFDLCDGCSLNHPLFYWATITGPAFTFLLMWIGWFQMKKSDSRSQQTGFALIFANFPINRMFFCLIDSNDEQWVARHLFGNSSVAFWITIMIIWSICLPPLIAAYRIIENKRKVLLFAAFFFLPFVFVIVVAGFLEIYVLGEKKILSNTILGIPYLILLVEAICFVGYARFKKYFLSEVNR
jgi:hypothetical protein